MADPGQQSARDCVGWVGQDDFELVVDSFTLEQALGISVPGAVGLGQVGQNRFRFGLVQDRACE